MVKSETAKQLLETHGEVRSQPASDWTGEFLLPRELERFYLEVGPVNVTIESYGNPYYLPCLADLWAFQAGYRWNGSTNEFCEDWPDTWIVVADEGGDPFIFDQRSRNVLHAYCGTGTWNAHPIFPDLNTMAACLAQLGAIVLQAGNDFIDDDSFIRSEWRKLAKNKISEITSDNWNSSNLLKKLSWE